MAEPPDPRRRDRLYEEAVATFDGALARLARAYEADADRRRDLLQELHVALWRSLASFNGQCSLKTWVYRVAHNRAITGLSPTNVATKVHRIKRLLIERVSGAKS